MDDLRAAVATVLALTPVSRLVAIDAADLVDAAALAVYAAVARTSGGAPRTVVADPLRLPFVAAIADLVVARDGGIDAAQLREIWRILAPAGALVLVVPVPASHSPTSLIARRIIRRRVARALAAAMFEPVVQRPARGAVVIRAAKRDGLAPPRPIPVTAQTPALV